MTGNMRAYALFGSTPAQKRNTIYEILDKGLFTDDNGKLSVSAKNRLLELLGYASLAGERELGELNRARAGEENLKMRICAGVVFTSLSASSTTSSEEISLPLK